MQIWQLQEAKAKLSQLVKMSESSPQVVSLHGVPKAVIMNIEEYHNLVDEKNDMVSFFQNSPLKGLELEITRDTSTSRTREIELG